MSRRGRNRRKRGGGREEVLRGLDQERGIELPTFGLDQLQADFLPSHWKMTRKEKEMKKN
jgi:hypothetical protein